MDCVASCWFRRHKLCINIYVHALFEIVTFIVGLEGY